MEWNLTTNNEEEVQEDDGSILNMLNIREKYRKKLEHL